MAKKTLEELRSEFWLASNQTLFNRATVAAALCRSIAWLDLKATTGGGPPFRKCGRLVFYTKVDVLDWINANSQLVRSTSEYQS